MAADVVDAPLRVILSFAAAARVVLLHINASVKDAP